MQTQSKWSENTYVPFLKAADENHLSRDHFGQRLIYPEVYIVCENTSYEVKTKDGDQIKERIAICQKEGEKDGKNVDTEDRIVKIKEFIKANLHMA
jgi:hypothetical protein